MSNISKMREAQRKAKEWFIVNGYVSYTVPHSRWSKDIFGLFDGIALKKGQLVLFQVKTGRFPGMGPYVDFMVGHSNHDGACHYQVLLMRWRRKDGLGVRWVDAFNRLEGRV